MKCSIENGSHCFYWGKNGFWIITNEVLETCRENIKNWLLDDPNPDYRFIYEETLDTLDLIDWSKVPEKKKEKIIEYLKEAV